jgi:hypothetical protein
MPRCLISQYERLVLYERLICSRALVGGSALPAMALGRWWLGNGPNGWAGEPCIMHHHEVTVLVMVRCAILPAGTLVDFVATREAGSWVPFKFEVNNLCVFYAAGRFRMLIVEALS